MQLLAGGKRMSVRRCLEPECHPEDFTHAQPVANSGRLVSVENPEWLLEDLRERPEGDALAVGQAAPGSEHGLGCVSGEPSPQLAYEAGLSDPRVADQRYQVWFLHVEGSTKGRS